MASPSFRAAARGAWHASDSLADALPTLFFFPPVALYPSLVA